MSRAHLSCAGLAIALASPLGADSISTIVHPGQSIPNQGNVLAILGLSVSNAGQVLVHVRTDNPNPDADTLLLDRNGAVAFYEGQPLNAPAGAVISSFRWFMHSSTGEPVFSLGLAPSGTGGNALYKGANLDLVYVEGSVCTAPQLPAGSAFSQLLNPRLNASGKIACLATIDDPSIAGAYDYGGIAVFDTVTGAHSAPYKKNDFLPGQPWQITSFVWNNGFELNDAGQILFGATTAASVPTQNVLYLNGTKIAQKSEPSPWGDNYTWVSGSLYNSDVNNAGEVAFVCSLNNAKAIVRDGEPFVRDTVAGVEPNVFGGYANQIHFGDDGRVVWGGYWQVSGVQHRGIFLDRTLIIESWSTHIDGLEIESLSLTSNNFVVSQSGQYMLFEATMTGGLEGAYLMDLWQ